MFYSGESKQERNGVEFMVIKMLKNNILDFKAIKGRLIPIRVHATPHGNTLCMKTQMTTE